MSLCVTQGLPLSHIVGVQRRPAKHPQRHDNKCIGIPPFTWYCIAGTEVSQIAFSQPITTLVCCHNRTKSNRVRQIRALTAFRRLCFLVHTSQGFFSARLLLRRYFVISMLLIYKKRCHCGIVWHRLPARRYYYRFSQN